MSNNYESGLSNKELLVLFWLYVLIPLAWGVTNTITQAAKLFH
ncbi:hypothetical protein BUMB_03485 [Candidatus Paraburkholderia calva]|nr:hypothetical protein BUMB_03485 [Candidatus Paraburkholderia calva]